MICNRDLAETGIVCGRVVPYGDTDGFAGALKELMEKVAARFDLNKLARDVFQTYVETEN